MADTPEFDLLRRLQEAVRNLPKAQRQVFIAHRLDGLSYEEIGRLNGLTVRQVERHVAKAIYKLDKQLRGRKLSWWERWF